VSIMRMEEGLDTGPVAAQVRETIAPSDTAGTLSVRLARLGARLLAETLPEIAHGRVSLREQDASAATLAPPLGKSDGRLDFHQPAAAVSARARGVDPWPGASATLQGEVAKLFGPTVVGGTGTPGEFLGLVAQGLAVACGDGAVAFAEVQLPGGKRMSGKALLAGHPIRPGTLLGGG
jgi:methionyl-tRNA formyltransferase